MESFVDILTTENSVKVLEQLFDPKTTHIFSSDMEISQFCVSWEIFSRQDRKKVLYAG